MNGQGSEVEGVRHKLSQAREVLESADDFLQSLQDMEDIGLDGQQVYDDIILQVKVFDWEGNDE
jgi:hypothetical protein